MLDRGLDKLHAIVLMGASTVKRTSLVVLALVGMAFTPDFAKAGSIYFADEGTHSIRRADLNGSNVTTIVSGLSAPRGLAIDNSSQQIYWTDAFAHVIQRSNLNGTDVQTLITTTVTLNTLALDVPDGKMFFTGSTNGLILEANLDGTGLHSLITGLSAPIGAAVDPLNGKVYWTGSGGVQSANLNGSDIQTLAPVVGRDIELDLAHGKMYVGGNTGIYSANLDGSNLQLLTTTSLQFSQMGLDLTARKIYWSDIGTETIYRMNIDGSGVQPVITSGLILPRDIAILDPQSLPEPSSLLLAVNGALALFGYRYRRRSTNRS